MLVLSAIVTQSSYLF